MAMSPIFNYLKPAPTNSKLANKWAVAVAAAVVHSLHAACVYIGPSTLLSPMRHSLNLTVAQATLPLVAFRIVQAIFLIPVGYILDSYPQFFLRASMVAAAILSPLLPLSTSLMQLVILQTLLGVTKLFGGLSAMLILITRAFPDGSGHATATGILLGGFSFAGFLAPTAIGFVSVQSNWRVASAILSLLFAVVGLPLTFYFLREESAPTRTPFTKAVQYLRNMYSGELKGSRAVATNGSQEKTGIKRREVLLTAPYIAVLIAVAAYSFSVHIIFDHLVIFLSEDFGMAFDRAIIYMSLLNLVAMFAKLSIGPLADRYNKAFLMTICSLLSGLSCLLLLEFSATSISVTRSVTRINCFVFIYAIGFAAVFSLTTSVLVEFGMARFGLRSNINVMTAVTAGSAGSFIAGWLRTKLGSYKWPFIWNALVWMLVAAASLFKYLVHDKRLVADCK